MSKLKTERVPVALATRDVSVSGGVRISVSANVGRGAAGRVLGAGRGGMIGRRPFL